MQMVTVVAVKYNFLIILFFILYVFIKSKNI
nr:MAG TPA: hypothetical protein [Caudoviricetes sp.]